MNSKEKTTILVTRKTCEELKSLGRKGETYDDIITRLIREINRQEFIAQQYKKLEEKDKFIPPGRVVMTFEIPIHREGQCYTCNKMQSRFMTKYKERKIYTKVHIIITNYNFGVHKCDTTNQKKGIRNSRSSLSKSHSFNEIQFLML